MRGIYSPKNDISSIVRLMESGAGVTDCEILTVLLDGVSEFATGEQTAQALLQKFGSLNDVCSASVESLMVVEGVGMRGAQLLKACKCAVTNLIHSGGSDNMRRLYTHEEIVDYLCPYFLNEKVEKLYLLMLNPKYKVLGLTLIAKGDTDKLVFDKKFILDEIIRHNASSVVLAHNHFISALPSADDVIITEELQSLFDQVRVKLYDHIIFCESDAKSMRKSGYIRQKDNSIY